MGLQAHENWLAIETALAAGLSSMLLRCDWHRKKRVPTS
jgi:hypothetical protein